MKTISDSSACSIVGGIPSIRGARDFHYGDVDQTLLRAMNDDVLRNGRQVAFGNLYANLGEKCDRIVEAAVNDYWLPWLPLIEADSSDRVLDIGSGWGHVSVNMARRGCNVTAVDSSIERLRYVQSRFYEESLVDAEVLHCSDMRNLPFADNSFSLVIMDDVIDRFPEMCECSSWRVQQSVLFEARRVLAENGTLVISTWNRWSLRNLRAFAKRPNRNHTHGILAYKRMLSRAGFRHVREMCALQDHQCCQNMFDLSNRAACAYAVKSLMWLGRPSRLLLTAAQRMGLLYLFVPSYIIFASTTDSAEVLT